MDSGPAPIDAAPICFGKGLVKDICFTPPLVPEIPLPGVKMNPLNTDVDANCTQVVTQPGGPALCVIAAGTINVAGTFIAIGTRPLVLLGADVVNVMSSGVVDVSSRSNNPLRKGAGANTGPCTIAGVGANDGGGGGGGAGASFGTIGGKGGDGDANNGPAVGGVPGAAQTAITILRGGCKGAAGGNNGAGVVGGDGGGAVYLIAGNAIAIAGDVFASGAGGNADGGNGGDQDGGAGGGAGGMIGLDAPTITINGRVVANGGGGAGGGANDGGTDAGEGTTTSWDARAAAGAGDQGRFTQDGNGGNGAEGTAIDKVDNLDGANATAGGGGGAGGLGVVWIDGAVTGGAMVSPAPTPH